jgi:hypothetical protein
MAIKMEDKCRVGYWKQRIKKEGMKKYGRILSTLTVCLRGIQQKRRASLPYFLLFCSEHPRSCWNHILYQDVYSFRHNAIVVIQPNVNNRHVTFEWNCYR